MHLRGVELRYVLTLHLFLHGTSTISELAAMLARRGFWVSGRTSKAISDALRWEQEHGRVWRRGRGRYRAGLMPRSTEYRIHKRVRELHARAVKAAETAEAVEMTPAADLVAETASATDLIVAPQPTTTAQTTTTAQPSAPAQPIKTARPSAPAQRIKPARPSAPAQRIKPAQPPTVAHARPIGVSVRAGDAGG